MTNPCYGFAVRSHSNIPNSYRERRHTPQRTTSPATPSSQESIDDLEFCRQRGDRGRWKTDGRVNIAGGFGDSNSQSCQCSRCAYNLERNSCDFSDPSPPRRTRNARRHSGGNGLDQKRERKPPPPVPTVEHSLWNPMQLLRRPHPSTERQREQEASRLTSSGKYRSSSRLRSETSSRSRDARDSRSPSRVPHRSSKVRSLRRTPSQQRKLSPRRSSPGRCSSGKTHSVGSRRSYIDTPSPPCAEKFDIACQTRRDDFPLTPDETPTASPIRRVVASDRPSHNSNPTACASHRRPSSCRCGATACASAPPWGCCCSVCVGWQERTQCQKPVVAPQTTCQGSRHGNCCAAVGNQLQSCHQGVCPKVEPPSVRHSECSKCHQPLPLIK